ncbi:MAG: diaminopimelate epimerase [Deltaproteobacteria bacterium]|nr:diaminopimelate epimerase [Deltaproteobacteria bacterium]
MTEIEFWKMSGSGNDFIIIDNRNESLDPNNIKGFIKRVCGRRTSVGADGLILIIKSKEYDFAWKFFNPDGNEVEMCGNGGRCIARFAYLKDIAGPEMTFDTLAGPIHASVKGRRVRILMPKIQDFKKDLSIGEIPDAKTIDFINTGVPHVVVIVDNIENYPVFDQGRKIRYHESFHPLGTNANFATINGMNRLNIRTYERGVEDETFSCGTGAVAAALTASARDLVSPPVEVKTKGGEILRIDFRKEGPSFKEVYMEGDTSIIYQARLNPEAYC